jgi:hypothetical protein
MLLILLLPLGIFTAAASAVAAESSSWRYN